jgi:hypothetical protein
MSLPLSAPCNCALLCCYSPPASDFSEERGTDKYLPEGNVFPENIFQKEDRADQGKHTEREDHQEFHRVFPAIVFPEVPNRSSRLV